MDCSLWKHTEKMKPVKNADQQENNCQSRSRVCSQYQYFMERLCEQSWQAQNLYGQTRVRALTQDTFSK